jgi:hypothetical protein
VQSGKGQPFNPGQRQQTGKSGPTQYGQQYFAPPQYHQQPPNYNQYNAYQHQPAWQPPQFRQQQPTQGFNPPPNLFSHPGYTHQQQGQVNQCFGGTYPVTQEDCTQQQQGGSLGTLFFGALYESEFPVPTANKFACLSTIDEDEASASDIESDNNCRSCNCEADTVHSGFKTVSKKQRKKHKPTWTSAKDWLSEESPRFLCNVGSENEWERLEAMIDSGACDHVCPPEFASKFPIQETQASKAGKCFISANGGKIRNLGRKDITGYCVTGQMTELKLQVAENLKSALFSVSKLERSGNKVVFDEQGSYIYNRTTDTYTPLRKHNGAYMLDIWVRRSNPCDQLTGKIVPVLNDVPQTLQDDLNAAEDLCFPRLPYNWE